MDYRTLGRSGCAVSSFCLGTMTFGTETDEPGAHEQLDHFAAAGGTFIDTADVYSQGRSEEILGRWFASRPDSVTGVSTGENDVAFSTSSDTRWTTSATAGPRTAAPDCTSR